MKALKRPTNREIAEAVVAAEKIDIAVALDALERACAESPAEERECLGGLLDEIRRERAMA